MTKRKSENINTYHVLMAYELLAIVTNYNGAHVINQKELNITIFPINSAISFDTSIWCLEV